jgi:hypothetical protein
LRTGDENRVISPLVVLEGIKQLLASHSFFNGLKWWPGRELNPRRQPFQTGVNQYLQRLNRSLGGCVRRYKVAKEVLILGGDLGLEWNSSNQNLHSEIGNSPKVPGSGGN